MVPEEEAAPAEQPVEAAEQAAGDGMGAADDKGVGARVSAVFTAAEKAAQHIVTLAREEANDMRRRVEAEAETYRREARNAAEQEAQRIIDEAHSRAAAIQAQAEANAEEIENGARVRELRIREEVRLLDERVEWARDGLREVTARLQQVFLDDSGPEPPDRRPEVEPEA